MCIAKGDSGFLVLRDGVVVFRTKPQQHFFDCPLQFAACPEYVEETDSVDDADVFDVSVEYDDIIVTGELVFERNDLSTGSTQTTCSW